jgi:DNA-directed RNA polymerase omega subunit
MSDTDQALPVVEPTPVKKPRTRPVRFEPEIYVEDVIAEIPNKYLAVNVAAQRARVLNERDLPVGDAAKQAKKPTTQALLELIEGRLSYEVILPRPALSDADVPFDDETDEDVAALFDEYADDDAGGLDDLATDFEDGG